MGIPFKAIRIVPKCEDEGQGISNHIRKLFKKITFIFLYIYTFMDNTKVSALVRTSHGFKTFLKFFTYMLIPLRVDKRFETKLKAILFNNNQ